MQNLNEMQSEAQPLVTASGRLDANLQKRLMRVHRLIYLILLIAGAAMVIACIPLDVLAAEEIVAQSDWYNILLWLGALMFAVGLVCTLMLRSGVKRADTGLANEYSFYGDHFSIRTTRGTECVAVANFRYSECAKIRESRDFFLLYQNRANVFPVEKIPLSQEERARLRELLRLPKKNK